MLHASRHILSNLSTIVTSPQPASLDRLVSFIGTKLSAMSESAFAQRMSRLSRATRSTASYCIALRAQLNVLMPTESAMSKSAMLEDRVRQLEDVESMLSEFVSMFSTDIEGMLTTEDKLRHFQRQVVRSLPRSLAVLVMVGTRLDKRIMRL